MSKQLWDIGSLILQLGEIFVGRGQITGDDLSRALEVQSIGDDGLGIKPGEMLGSILVKMGYIEPMTLVRTLCEQKGMVDFIPVGDYLVEPRVIFWMPQETAEEFSILPLVTFNNESMMVAVSEPLSAEDEAKVLDVLNGKRLEFLQVKDDDLQLNIEGCYKRVLRRGLSGVRIGEILVRDGFVSAVDFQEALDFSKEKQRLIGRVLIERGKVDETDLFRILSIQRGIPFVSSEDIFSMLDKSLATNLNRDFCTDNQIVPYSKEDGKLYVATSEPSIDPDQVKKALGCKQVYINLATYSDIAAISKELFVD